MGKTKKSQDIDEAAGRDVENELDDTLHEEAADTSKNDEGPFESEGDSENAKYENELQETKAHWQRALADYQNLKKRILSDTDQEVKRVKLDMLSQLLLVLDYLEMALAGPVESQEAKNLLIGVEMTRDQMVSFLENQGASPIHSEGQFDPVIHQAFESVEDPAREPGEIVKTVRRGFRLGEDVLRHAQVIVVKASDPDEAEEA